MTQQKLDTKPAVAPKAKPNLKYMRDKMREMVKGIFRFHEAPGQTLHFNYREFKEDPIEKYSLEDGKVCSIPLGVAKHINKNMWYPVHQHILDEAGKASVRVGQKARRATFQSLEFVDIEDIDPAGDLITVESV